MTAHEQFCFTTTRIEAFNTNDSTGCVGTGFFFSCSSKNGNTKVLLITNKHIAINRDKIRIHISTANERKEPNLNSYINLELTGKMRLYLHPNPQIDLCALDITSLVQNMIYNGKRIFYRSFMLKDIPTPEQTMDIDPITEVEMVGYPNSLWDNIHNMPLFRRCFTASRLDLDWQGKKIFLLDGTCVEGSSGSPIILYNDSYYHSRKTNEIRLGKSRMFLLGIQFARANRRIEGELKLENGQKISNVKPVFDISNNI